MKIEILGPGCARCKKLYAEAEKAIAASGLAVEMEKVERIEDMVRYGIMRTPALVLDGKVKASGRIPSSAEIAAWIAKAAAEGEA